MRSNFESFEIELGIPMPAFYLLKLYQFLKV